MASAADYVALIPSQHRDKPNFVAMVSLLVQAFVDGINQWLGLVNDLDLDLAIGAQLDLIGAWVGLPRQVQVPITGVFFSFDTVGLGFDQGIWQPTSNPNGITSMSDDQYRLMMRAKIACNFWDGSLGRANAILTSIFPGLQVYLRDNLNMTESFVTNGSVNAVLFFNLVNGGYIPFKPGGVAIV